MSRVRADHEGSFYQRKDGRWVASVRVGDKRVSRCAKNEDEALAKLKQLHTQELTQTLAVPTRLRLGEWVE